MTPRRTAEAAAARGRWLRRAGAALLPGLAQGEYTLRCRTIDEKGHAQPMPRPFRKGGTCDIQTVNVTVG